MTTNTSPTPYRTPKMKAYLEKVEAGRTTKWDSIKLTEFARTLNSTEIRLLIPVVHEIVVGEVNRRLEVFQSMNTPQIIVDNQVKLVAKADRGQNIFEATLSRTLKRKELDEGGRMVSNDNPHSMV